METGESLKEAAGAAGAPPAAADALDLWAGPDASSHIKKKLSAAKPQDALADIRRLASLRDAGCKPLLAMLELQGVPASSAHKRLLDEVHTPF